MRILLIADTNLKSDGGSYYSFDQKLYNGLIRNGHNVYFFGDRDIARQSCIRTMGINKANTRLIKTVQNFNPEMIILGHVDIMTSETLNKMKQICKCPIALFNIDVIFSSRNLAKILFKSRITNANFITTGGKILKKLGNKKSKFYFIPNIVDSSIETEKAFDNNCKYDVFFAGRNEKKSKWRKLEEDESRSTIPLYLQKEINYIKYGYFAFNNMQKLSGYNYVKTLGTSKIGLNLSRKKIDNHQGSKEEIFLYSSDRIAQYTGNGILTMTQKDFGLGRLYTEDEMVFFDKKEDLKEKIIHLIKNDDERIRIARNGWLKAHKYFNEKLVAQYIVEKTMNIKSNITYLWDGLEN